MTQEEKVTPEIHKLTKFELSDCLFGLTIAKAFGVLPLLVMINNNNIYTFFIYKVNFFKRSIPQSSVIISSQLLSANFATHLHLDHNPPLFYRNIN